MNYKMLVFGVVAVALMGLLVFLAPNRPINEQATEQTETQAEQPISQPEPVVPPTEKSVEQPKLSVPAQIVPAPKPTSAISVFAIQKALNEERVKNNLSVFHPTQALQFTAELKLSDMLDNGYVGYTSPDGKNLFTFLNMAGARYTYAVEFVSNNKNIEEIMASFKDILNPRLTDM